MYTYKVEQAIKAAGLLHQDQLRKGMVPLPYITHLMSTMLILRDYTDDEDTLVAALLHDTIEDTDYTYDELVGDFGEDVAKYVQTVTEPTGENKDWLEVKKAYAKQIKKGPEPAVLIAAADKTHNFRMIVEEYFDDHHRYIQDFGPKIQTRLEAYQDIANAINSRLKDGIVHEFNHTFDLFKEFLFNVQDTQDS